MKSRTTAALAALAVGLSLTVLATEKPASGTKAEAAENRPPGTFKTEVVRVISAQDGEAVFRAYLVKWKGQEVVVDDPLAMTDYKVGDTVTVLAMNLPHPGDKPGTRLLRFHIIANPPKFVP